MRDAISDAQWAAARALVEGEPATHARVAGCMGIHATTLAHHAGVYGWRSLDFRRPRVRQAQRALVALAAAAREGREMDGGELLDLARAGDEAGLDEAGRDAVAAIANAFEGGSHGGTAAARAAGIAESPFDPLPELPPRERAARLRLMLTGRMEEMLCRAESGRPVEGRQVAALAALAQLVEKIAPAAPPDEERRMEAVEREAVMAGALDKIDRRIGELARHFAAEALVEVAGMSEAEAERAIRRVSGKAA